MSNVIPVDSIEPWVQMVSERHIESIELFGSRARGDERATSDWDVLITVKDMTPEHWRPLVFDVLIGMSQGIDVLFLADGQLFTLVFNFDTGDASYELHKSEGLLERVRRSTKTLWQNK